MSAHGSSEPLPALYAGWLEDLLGAPIPRESRATCDDCAMPQRVSKLRRFDLRRIRSDGRMTGNPEVGGRYHQ